MLEVLKLLYCRSEEYIQMLYDVCRTEDGKISIKSFLEVSLTRLFFLFPLSKAKIRNLLGLAFGGPTQDWSI